MHLIFQAKWEVEGLLYWPVKDATIVTSDWSALEQYVFLYLKITTAMSFWPHQRHPGARLSVLVSTLTLPLHIACSDAWSTGRLSALRVQYLHDLALHHLVLPASLPPLLHPGPSVDVSWFPCPYLTGFFIVSRPSPTSLPASTSISFITLPGWCPVSQSLYSSQSEHHPHFLLLTVHYIYLAFLGPFLLSLTLLWTSSKVMSLILSCSLSHSFPSQHFPDIFHFSTLYHFHVVLLLPLPQQYVDFNCIILFSLHEYLLLRQKCVGKY